MDRAQLGEPSVRSTGENSTYKIVSVYNRLHFQESLIHLGAKFSPCMRQDQQVHDLIRDKRAIERNSACCVRNDRSGCVQTSEEECSVRLLRLRERSQQPGIISSPRFVPRARWRCG